MREKLLLTTKSWFNRIMLLCVLVCASAAGRAADPVDLGELELGKEYTMTANYKGFVATFKAPKTGVLTCEGSIFNSFRPYTDAEHTASIGKWEFSTSSMTLNVTEGQIIYFLDPWGWYSGAYKLTMPGDEGVVIEVNSVSPENGSVAPTAANGRVSVLFNVPVKVLGSADLYVGDSKIGSAVSGVSGGSLSIEIAPMLLKAYDNNQVQEGDILTIKFKVQAQYDEKSTKDVEVKYTCPKAIVRLAQNKSHIPAAFLSYWITNDVDGVLKLEFTGDLDPKGGVATLGYGDLESESDYYSENLNYTTDGKYLLLDLTGKLRTPDNMLPAGTKYDVMSIQISGVKDADGNFVYSEGIGTIGSFAYNLPYKALSYDVDTEFTPAEGGSLANATEVEIWMRGENALSYDGVKFSYVENGETKDVVVAMADLKREVAGEDVTLTVTVPAEVKGKSNITVTLNNLQSKDGLNHDVSARYDAFVITVNQPAENTMEMLASGTIINVTTNSDKVGYMEYEVHDLNAESPDEEIIKSYSWLNKQENGSWEAETYGNYKLYKNHDYAIVFTAWTSEENKRNGEPAIGSDTYIIHGATMPYINSSLQLLSVTPSVEDGFANEDDNVVTLTFDGLVMLDSETTFINEGSGSSSPFESIVPVEPTEGYANVWQLTVPKSNFSGKSSVDISFVATDMEGRRLNGNENRTGEVAYFYYSIPCAFTIPDFTVIPADGSELNSLSQITVGYDAGINPSWDGSKIEVYNIARELVATVVEEESVIPEEQKDNWDYQPKEMILTLDKTLDKDGSYYIQFPAGHFVLGTQFDSYSSKQTIVGFTINNPIIGPATEIKVAMNENGTLVLEFAENVEAGVNYGCTEKATVKDAAGTVVYEFAVNNIDFDWELPLNYLIVANANITEPGEYTVEFPAGMFYTDAAGTVESTAATATLVIEGEAPVLAGGTYYMKNVESGLYLTAGNSWGTRGTLAAHGLDLIVTQLEDGKYTIDTQITEGKADKPNNHYLGENGFMDAVPANWNIVAVENGVYNITLDGEKFLGYTEGSTELTLDLTDAASAAAQWVFVTKEELLAEMANATEANPVDATFLISGQNFNRNDPSRNAAWQGAPKLGGDNTNFCAEKYNCIFDVYQTLTDIPNGIYEVSVQGFYRNGNNNVASAAHNNGTEALNAMLYANTETTSLMSVYAESKEAKEGGWSTSTEAGFVPNDMANASAVFTAGAYAGNKVQVIVTDGTLTIGVKKEVETSEDWTIFDNFELTYLGEVKAAEFITVNAPVEDTMEMLTKGTIINITVNSDVEVGYVEYEIHDLNPERPELSIIKSFSWMTKQADGNWQATIYGSGYKLLEGHDYAVIFSAYTSEDAKRAKEDPVGVYEHIIHGASAAYKNSDLELVSIDRDADHGFTSEEDNVVTVTFSGLVKLDASTTYVNGGFGTQVALESITPVEPTENGYATTWQLAVAPSTFESAVSGIIDIAMVAFDEEGRRLNGNGDRTGETAFFYYSIPCSFVLPDLTVNPADGAVLKSLEQITVSYSGGVNTSYDGSKIYVYDKTRNVVATVVKEEHIVPEDQKDNMDYTATEMVLTLNKTVDADGEYVIIFPAGHFSLGTQFTGSSSKETIVSFTIDNPVVGPATELAVTENPEGGFLLTFAEGTSVSVNYNNTDNVLVKDAEGATVLEIDNNAFSFGFGFNELIMAAELSTPGTYTIEFPAGKFYLNDAGTVESTAVTVTYVVVDTAIDGIAADGENFAVYSLAGALVKADANKADLKNLPAGIYIVNGKKYLVK